MKKFILITVSFILSSNVFSQETKQVQKIYKVGESFDIGNGKNIYIKDDYINKFVGSWEWKQGNELLIFKFEKITCNLDKSDSSLKMDLKKGTFEYMSNGMIKSPMNGNSISGSSQGKENILYISVFDTISKTGREFQLEMTDNETVKLELSTRREGKIYNSLVLPTSIFLKKILIVSFLRLIKLDPPAIFSIVNSRILAGKPLPTPY